MVDLPVKVLLGSLGCCGLGRAPPPLFFFFGGGGDGGCGLKMPQTAQESPSDLPVPCCNRVNQGKNLPPKARWKAIRPDEAETI